MLIAGARFHRASDAAMYLVVVSGQQAVRRVCLESWMLLRLSFRQELREQWKTSYNVPFRQWELGVLLVSKILESQPGSLLCSSIHRMLSLMFGISLVWQKELDLRAVSVTAKLSLRQKYAFVLSCFACQPKAYQLSVFLLFYGH